MGYRPIEDYGVIGDLHTAALVSVDGEIDWLCYPRFDSPSVFGSLLDHAKGGTFRVSPSRPHTTRKQMYWPHTNILVTRFFSDAGMAEVVDFMPVGTRGTPGAPFLIRKVHAVRGEVAFRLACRPAFDYARAQHETRLDGAVATFQSPDLTLQLVATDSASLHSDDEGGVRAEFALKAGETVAFALREPCERPFTVEEAEGRFQAAVDYWQKWASRCTYTGRWREVVERSALALKLMTYEPTGAIIAAPTCSLPESIGGERNWDYRYTWIRDAAFTLYGLMRIGFTEEAGRFMAWIEERCRESCGDAPLQALYGIDGRHEVPESTLDHLEGYRGSRPVRIGNGAAEQLQLDVSGALMSAAYL